ncbi:MAG: DUF5686 family protein [Longimicrobiales bacterium]|nr:DUF5686 family protein [Longimicrobiales bacterium]
MHAVLVCAAAALPADLAAQARHPVFGQVLAGDTGQGLADVLISVEGSGERVLTNQDGAFQILLPEGTHTLVATTFGYGRQTRSVEAGPGLARRIEFILRREAIALEGILVELGATGRRVREMAAEREERRKSLRNYSSTIHRLTLVYEDISDADRAEEFSLQDTTEVIGFSERIVRQTWMAPRSYSERVVGRRSSDNYFSEVEIFGSGGSALDLNAEVIDMSILTEVVSVIGPISSRAPDFYEIIEDDAGPEWPAGTTRITVRPKSQSRPLFDGYVYVEDATGTVIGVDLAMNEASDVHSGIASVENFRYRQSFDQVEDYWLPTRTEIQADVWLIGFPHVTLWERWNHTDYQINSEAVARVDMPLSGVNVDREAGSRSEAWWEERGLAYLDPDELSRIREAQEYEEDRFLVNMVMAGFRAWAAAPAWLENGYLTNISDFYRFNRVEGHYFGVGLRTPSSQKRHQYKASVGVGTESEDVRYYVEGRQFIPGTQFAVEGGIYNKLAIQFADYPHAVGPTNVDEFRFTLAGGLAGYDPRNYFEREGFEAGLRWQAHEGLFVRGGFIREDHEFLPVVRDDSFIGGEFETNLNPNVSPTPVLGDGSDALQGFTPGELSGFQFQLHYDNRQYRTVGLFKDYLVREFGWYTDHLVYWSDPDFGSDDKETFDFVKYRSTAGIRLPIFSSHFLLARITVGGSDNPLPAQIQFGHNGVYVEDYLRHRPFLSLDFDEGIGNRVSTVRVEYDLGSGFSRLFPWQSIRQSGVQFKFWGAGGVRDHDASLRPATPWTDGVDEHLEVGFALTRLMGIFSIDLALRLEGDEGDRVGFTFIL